MDTKVLELLWDRKATRAIAKEPVEPEKLDAVLEAARLAPSCRNNQPWRFLVLDEPNALEKGRAALSRGNYWAKTAPILIYAYSRVDWDCRSRDGREYFLLDLGLAVQDIMLQATELDLVARPMAGFSPKEVREAFGLSDECQVMVALAIGYEGDISTLKEKDQETSLAARQRKPLEEIVHFNGIGRESG